MTDENSIR
jgi:hypothetical protein